MSAVAEGMLDPHERQTLGALRYAVNEEAAAYLAIMRLFTAGMSGFLSDQSAEEVSERLAAQGFELDRDVVDQRLSYLVEHGNLARSPRESDARSVGEYLANRARYQLTQRGELVHRQVEELLAHSDSAREVSSEMLPGILRGIEDLARISGHGLETVDPRDLAGRITTLFAQFEVLVSSTRQFYSYLTQVLTRFDLGREEFEMFKSALLDYLQRFIDEISRHMPQVADRLRELEPSVPSLCERANAGERLVGLDGASARRATGLEPGDWESLHMRFVGAPGRRSDADNVRRLATDAMRSLLMNLRRIAAGADRQQSRYGDLVRLAGWFDAADDAYAHDLWAAAFGLYSARHLSFAADPDGDPVGQQRKQALGQEVGAVEEDVGVSVEYLLGHVPERGRPADAGVVDQEVERGGVPCRGERFSDPFREVRDGRDIGDVQGQGGGLATFGQDLSHRRVALTSMRPVRRNDGDVVPGEFEGRGLADAGAASGDEGDPHDGAPILPRMSVAAIQGRRRESGVDQWTPRLAYSYGLGSMTGGRLQHVQVLPWCCLAAAGDPRRRQRQRTADAWGTSEDSEVRLPCRALPSRARDSSKERRMCRPASRRSRTSGTLIR